MSKDKTLYMTIYRSIKVYDPKKPFYREDFDRFLNSTYGEDADPFGTGHFEW